MQPRKPAFDAAQPLRLAVLLSGSGTTLANLLDRIRDGQLTHVTIARAVSSRGGVRGLDIAAAAGIRAEVVRPRDFDDAQAFSDAVTRAVESSQADLIVMAGFLCRWLFPGQFNGRVLNIHPALLPDFGGAGMYGRHVHQAVLAAGRATSGCSVHIADLEYDHGPIVAQRPVPVLAGDSAETLAARVGQAEREVYPWVIQQVADRGFNWLSQARGLVV